MLAGIDLAMCPNLAVPAEVMQHVAQVESGTNPFAIGVVGGRLQRQPRNLAEAMATAQMLERRGYNYSLGIAQVNRGNLGRYGLETYAEAFDPCANLQAGASILADCYARAGHDWGKAFSCYYSGNFLTGYRDGYVQRVFASMRDTGSHDGGVAPIPLTSGEALVDARPAPSSRAGSYRVAIRSVALDIAARSAITGINRAAPDTGNTAPVPVPDSPPPLPTTPAPALAATGGDAVFHPVVRGPNDAGTPSATTSVSAGTQSDHADLHQEHADAAFVF